MKLLTPFLLASIALAPNALHAQARGRTTHARATHAHAAAPADTHGCVQVGELSAKIPALPAGASCPKALYTVSKTPSIKLDYVSPIANREALNDTFGIETSIVTLAYIDTKVGTGPLAAPNKFYSILYTGYLADGTEFDSSAKHGGEPIAIPYGKHNVILGWDTGFDGMHVGGKRRLFIPYELGYGSTAHPPSIPAKSELIFDVELVAQSDTAPEPKAPSMPPVSSTPPPASKPATMPPPAAKPETMPPAAAKPETMPAPAAKPEAMPAAAAKSEPAAATPAPPPASAPAPADAQPAATAKP
jgi:peptidylprolyl isomerase